VPCSQLKPAFPGAVGERRDPAVVTVAATVEHDARDAGVCRAAREQLADLARLGRLVAFGGSRVDAAASVRPAVSSTICANMCRADRLTTSRGRLALPVTFLRTRRCRRVRPAAVACVCDRTRPVARACDLVLVPAMTYFPAFPTLRRICSPWYRTPLPL